MAWLARLDARARSWPRPALWLYLAVKWYVIVMGALSLFYVWSQNIHAPVWLRAAGKSLLHALDVW